MLAELEADTHLPLHKENNHLFRAVIELEQRLTASQGLVPFPRIVRKTRSIEHLDITLPSALLVRAADKAHNARDTVADTRNDPSVWGKFRAGLDGSAWFLWSLDGKLKDLEPTATGRSAALLARVPEGADPQGVGGGQPEAHRPASNRGVQGLGR